MDLDELKDFLRPQVQQMINVSLGLLPGQRASSEVEIQVLMLAREYFLANAPEIFTQVSQATKTRVGGDTIARVSRAINELFDEEIRRRSM